MLYTGLALFNVATGKEQCEVVPYRVTFRKLTDELIESYLKGTALFLRRQREVRRAGDCVAGKVRRRRPEYTCRSAAHSLGADARKRRRKNNLTTGIHRINRIQQCFLEFTGLILKDFNLVNLVFQSCEIFYFSSGVRPKLYASVSAMVLPSRQAKRSNTFSRVG